MDLCVQTRRLSTVQLAGVLVLLTVSGFVPNAGLAQVSPASAPQASVSTGEPPMTTSSAGNEPNVSAAPGTVPNGGVPGSEAEQALGILSPSYDPSGRRDPFNALVNRGKGDGEDELSLPPLQRVGLTELNIIGVIWGGFGYTAMVQTPDGKGYTVRRGTRVGPNNGVVTSITEKGIVVTERFTDIYGKQQEREHVKLLHIDEETE